MVNITLQLTEEMIRLDCPELAEALVSLWRDGRICGICKTDEGKIVYAAVPQGGIRD